MSVGEFSVIGSSYPHFVSVSFERSDQIFLIDVILKDHRTVARSNEKLWYFLGKCYESITENFIPRPRKPRVDLEMDSQQSLANAETGKASDTRSNPNGNDTPNKLENISVSKYT